MLSALRKASKIIFAKAILVSIVIASTQVSYAQDRSTPASGIEFFHSFDVSSDDGKSHKTLVFVDAKSVTQAERMFYRGRFHRTGRIRYAETTSQLWALDTLNVLQRRARAYGLFPANDFNTFIRSNAEFFARGSLPSSLAESRLNELSELRSLGIQQSSSDVSAFRCEAMQKTKFSPSLVKAGRRFQKTPQRGQRKSTPRARMHSMGFSYETSTSLGSLPKKPHEIQKAMWHSSPFEQTRTGISLTRVVEQAANAAPGSDAPPFAELRDGTGAAGHLRFVCQLPIAHQSYWSSFDASSEAVPRNQGQWVRRIADSYPMRALREGVQGSVKFTATVTRKGRVEACNVVRSSGYEILDAAACRAVRRYARFNQINPLDAPLRTYTSTVNYRQN